MAASSTSNGEQIADGEGAATLQVPSGHRFVPTDSELVEHYLLNRILQLPMPCDIINYIPSLYSYDPEQLPIAQFIHGRENEAYFFTNVDSNHSQGAEQIKKTDGGYWKSCGGDHQIYSRHQIIGFKKTYAFFYRKDEPEGDNEARWMLFEYRVNPRIILPSQFNDIVKAQISRVICKLQYEQQTAVEDSEFIGEEESLKVDETHETEEC